MHVVVVVMLVRTGRFAEGVTKAVFVEYFVHNAFFYECFERPINRYAVVQIGQ